MPSHFRIVEAKPDQQTLFKTPAISCTSEGFADAAFLDSVIERGYRQYVIRRRDCLCHTLGCWRRNGGLYGAFAPQGIARGDETAHVIFTRHQQK
ncbi:hypothetical protein KCP73_09210 [Salmonella enterica subsp. enterica]|nr:hypothetical protein KCP73_09210 [Salmonella enterica subsp. enterica]